MKKYICWENNVFVQAPRSLVTAPRTASGKKTSLPLVSGSSMNENASVRLNGLFTVDRPVKVVKTTIPCFP